MPDSASTTPGARNLKENKTRTNERIGEALPLLEVRASAHDLGIERVWREVIDFGEPTSGNGDPDWGRKQISVARVTLLDGVLGHRGYTKE